MKIVTKYVLREHFAPLAFSLSALTSLLLIERPGLGTVAVDARWRLYYDPGRVLQLQQQHGIAALAGDWIHELMHVPMAV